MAEREKEPTTRIAPLPEISHKRWRHKKEGYVVQVLSIHNYGAPVSLRTVTVDRTRTAKKPRTWNALVFIKTFDPVGRASKPKTIWEHLP